ncbi:MAG: acyloxyacyl hydrolase [Bacteroidia bacterium]
MFFKKLLLSVCLLFSTILLAQQGDKNDFYIRGAFNYGFILQQHNSIGDLVNGNIGGFELNYVKPATGNKLWHYENNFPERGVGFTYYSLDNPKQLGNLYALYYFYDIPLNKNPKPFRLYMRICEGLAYTPTRFNPITNHKNEVISSPVNAYINFKWYWRWDIKPWLRWEAGFNFSHASNGRIDIPNLGINLVSFNTGLVYKFHTKNKTAITLVDSSTKVKSKNELLFWAAAGLNQFGQPGGKEYLAQSYSAAYYRNKRNTHKFGVGIDIYYNAANLAQLKGQGDTLSNKLLNIQVGVKLAYAYNIGRLSLPVEMGYYVYTRYKPDGIFFHRIGIRYYFANNVVGIISLKTNWGVANYIEFGVGYRLPLKPKIKV